MATLSWGKPKIEYAPAIDGEPEGEATWKEMPTIKQDSTELTPTKGDVQTATGEGGEIVDKRYNKNQYQLQCEIFVKKDDDEPPFDDEDGVVDGDWAIRLTPEDEDTEGFIMENATVSAEVLYTAADGKTIRYTFDAKKPKAGKILKPYKANE